jgi:hypothetical protein
MNQQPAFQLLTQYFQGAAATWRCIAGELCTAFANLNDVSFERERPATKFILTWMRELKRYQDNFGALIKRRKRPSVADDFTGAVAFSLEQFLATRGFRGLLRCEETTHRKRRASRPDVSLRSPLAEALIATIECKTDFGWNRQGWRDAFQARTDKLQQQFPGCASYLCVLFNKNWECAEKQWFCLSRHYPTRLGDPIQDSDILTPIEPMFLEIVAKMHATKTSDLIDAINNMSDAEKEKLRCALELQQPKAEPGAAADRGRHTALPG